MKLQKRTDVRVTDVETYLLPVRNRVPLKFGSEVLTSVTCGRVKVTVESRDGSVACGWGETPLSVQWAWPSPLSYHLRHAALVELLKTLAAQWRGYGAFGHPLEIGSDFLHSVLPTAARLVATKLARETAAMAALDLPAKAPKAPEKFEIPYLASLVVASVIDQAIHDAYGVLHKIDTYRTYDRQWMNRDLAALYGSSGADESTRKLFANRYPAEFLNHQPPSKLPVWHLVGGLDPLTKAELAGEQLDDGYPILLPEWIERDGLKCLKIKLRGDDEAWDYERLESIGRLGRRFGVEWLSADFNCTVRDPAYVNSILDRLRVDEPEIFDMVLYVEQPFPYDLAADRIDVQSVSSRKPLFLDESAHDWKHVRLGRELGWTGVALKTCKTQTGALLSLCWAKAHGMPLMVQDLTNPMLAQIPHVRLAAHADTIMGVECNAMQFYPEASQLEAVVHPGLYLRRNGSIDLSTLGEIGFGYRVDEIGRPLEQFRVQ